MKKIFDKLKSYLLLLYEFIVGSNKNVQLKKKQQKRFIDILLSYCMIVNEMGAGGKKK